MDVCPPRRRRGFLHGPKCDLAYGVPGGAGHTVRALCVFFIRMFYLTPFLAWLMSHEVL